MSADSAFAVEPVAAETSDGDGELPTAVAVAALIGAVLQRVMDRGPFFEEVVREAVFDIQNEAGE